ncbi:type VI secretion protein [Sphingorhabdus sp. IMCC26285]|uniref:Type VI secretion protein n=1 Tax=Sphingorhabdus profundilacus TaxID=2509718 RepID=A0A6I4M1L3_9SPHN|nr:TrbG/VirB9 family P-type conjugative transfer protein [Sphingorhabdus profundilacus]MVZ98243.1 type VI secretion protein [Sphingorhabdus profundilacus]
MSKMRCFNIIWALAIIFAGQQTIAQQASDNRVVERYYSAATVYRIAGVMGIQTAVLFGEEERIENIAIGDGSNWQVTPNKRSNILFIKPIATKKVTNLTIVTDRRTYLFELNSVDQKAVPIYTLRFIYPPDPVDPDLPDLTAIPPEAISDSPAVQPSNLKVSWSKSGKSNLWPSEIFDDGTLTYLRWPKTVTPPAIFSIGVDGTESLVNQLAQNDYFVIDFVPSAIMLRLGKAKARLDRVATPAPNAANLETGN